MFARYDQDGNLIRKRVVLDCSGDDVIVEQSHKNEVDINNIIKRYKGNAFATVEQLQSLVFDDVTGNDFMEANLMILKARESFMSLPSELRKRFDNNPASFLDFVQNPDNVEEMYDLGLMERPRVQEPVVVTIMNPETPSV